VKEPALYSRREVFSWKKLLYGAALLPLYAACKKQSSSSSSPTPPTNNSNSYSSQSPATSGVATSTAASQTATSSNTAICSAPPTIDLTAYPVIDETLQTTFAFYGDSFSTMMVMSCPKYTQGLLQSIIVILKPSGRVVAQRCIDPLVDIRPDTTMKDIVFDNLNIKSDYQVALLFKLTCTSCSNGFIYKKLEPTNRISYITTFQGTPVQTISSSSVSSLYATYSTRPQVWFQALNNSLFDSGDYFTATPNTTFQASGLTGLYITDLLSQTILASPGMVFTDFVNYPEFICYNLVSSGVKFYVRTFVRLY
jgi:hypothetical protein